MADFWQRSDGILANYWRTNDCGLTYNYSMEECRTREQHLSKASYEERS